MFTIFNTLCLTKYEIIIFMVGFLCTCVLSDIMAYYMLKNIEYEKMRKDLNKKDKEIGLLQEELEQRDKEIDQLLNMIVYLERETIKI